MKLPDKLAMMQIERRLENLRGFAKDADIRTSWIGYMRRAMCMTLGTLAGAARLSQATVQQIEKRETAGKVTLATMRRLAAVMDCEFIYAIVPRRGLKDLLKEKAAIKAARIVREADVHMTLEDQKVSADIKERIERITDELLAKGDIW